MKQPLHGKLFPRCAARSGVPQIVVPHLGDQFYWGQRTCAVGIAPAFVPKRRLRADPLASSLRACLEDAALRQRAAAFAPSVRADGLARAVAILEGQAAAG